MARRQVDAGREAQPCPGKPQRVDGCSRGAVRCTLASTLMHVLVCCCVAAPRCPWQPSALGALRPVQLLQLLHHRGACASQGAPAKEPPCHSPGPPHRSSPRADVALAPPQEPLHTASQESWQLLASAMLAWSAQPQVLWELITKLAGSSMSAREEPLQAVSGCERCCVRGGAPGAHVPGWQRCARAGARGVRAGRWAGWRGAFSQAAAGTHLKELNLSSMAQTEQLLAPVGSASQVSPALMPPAGTGRPRGHERAAHGSESGRAGRQATRCSAWAARRGMDPGMASARLR